MGHLRSEKEHLTRIELEKTVLAQESPEKYQKIPTFSVSWGQLEQE